MTIEVEFAGYSARVAPALDDRWNTVLPIRIGRIPSHLPEPDFYVLVDDADVKPVIRLDVYIRNDEADYGCTAIIWRQWTAIGFGSRTILISLRDQLQQEITVSNDYFSAFVPESQFLIVCFGTGLVRIEPDGVALWKNDQLGIDGVIVSQIEGDVILGNGEWDPPGGWRPFKVSLKTGRALEISD